MKFGVHLGPQELEMSDLRRAWRQIEDLGFDWISVWDHFYAAAPPFERPSFEATIAHAALAAETSNVRVGCLVYSAGYRHPAVLANAGVAIDHLSDGRLEMGIGAGWHQAEYDAYGLPFESPGVRLRRLAEYVQVVRLLWSETEVTFNGEFFQLSEARCDPKPQQALPPIWIGARGEKALALAGKLGDGWNVAYVSAAQFGRMLDTVRSHAAHADQLVTGVNVGLIGELSEAEQSEFLARRYGQGGTGVIEGVLLGSSSQWEDQVGHYVTAGADWLNLALRAPIEMDLVEKFATEVMPRFR
jgi:alkanesulfonate monooxygenase SsuD/methylene tetrahydromethanopterin reductase-like flavin-dependent oxidoreductase (luciferase family)